jgi:alkylation response protein AidB-like acyl-CoA dehydrogenase
LPGRDARTTLRASKFLSSSRSTTAAEATGRCHKGLDQAVECVLERELAGLEQLKSGSCSSEQGESRIDLW